jgi:primosomal protein N' (replication factor Y) (superfamily II helicase)
MPSRIAVVAIAAPLEKPLSYLVPSEMESRVSPGMRLRVPLGRRHAVGFVLEIVQGEGERLKPIAEILDEDPLFPPELIPFFRRASAYYHHPVGEVIRTAVPSSVASEKSRVRTLTERLFEETEETGEPPGAKQSEVLAWLRGRGATPLSAISRHFSAPHAVLARLVELGYLRESVRERRRDPFLDRPVDPDCPVEPTLEQAEALRAISHSLSAGVYSPFLLHGVTGSGKTEVYLRSIAETVSAGRRALLLVPEIALTPQLVGRFRARFEKLGTTIAVLHSGLSEGERYDAWRSIARGDVSIVIGARSAVFAPLDEIGIIVVDEEHEGSYKQGEGFRYNARDLALMRGQMVGAVVLLGSATPSLTSYCRAMEGLSGYLPLTLRALDRPLPSVELIDLRTERPEGSLSPSLVAALAQNLERRDQSLLLLNRRGFAPYLLCGDCGRTFRCPNCEITLTFYQGRRRMLCHYCDYAEPPPELCPGCGGGDVRPEGSGTERLEEELAALFPEARIARMDRDSTSRKGAHEALVTRMGAGEIDILVGTQMVAKGHDFPGVTLVGVVNADQALNLPDFRSAERAFTLLTQVAGRAGRGEKAGIVLFQTWAPDHYALQSAIGHDYAGFYAQEAPMRRALGYPPFGFLVNLVFSGLDAARVGRAASHLVAELSQEPEVEVLGPAPCPLARLRGKARVQVLLKGERRPPLHRLLNQVEALRRHVPRGVSLAIDVDPLDML